MSLEPIALQIILMITSALGLILWGIVQFTLNTINKRLSQIEIFVQEFVTYKAVHDKIHEQADIKFDDLKFRVDEHDDIIEDHEKKIDDHTKKIDNLSQQIKQNKEQTIRKITSRRKSEKDIK
jgi:peptidoglycan hydrolase CwlO-like protein